MLPQSPPEPRADPVPDGSWQNPNRPDLSSHFFFRADLVAIAFILALTLSYFLPALLTGHGRVLSSKGTDTWNQYFYWREFGFAALARGELPLWNPYVFGGMPFIGGMQSAIFYPLNWIFLVLNTAFAISLSIALHFFLTAVFTYGFCRYMELSVPAKAIGKDGCEKKMQSDAEVDSEGGIQDEKDPIQRIKNRRLHSADERHSAKHVRIPERQLAAREGSKAELTPIEILVPGIGSLAAEDPSMSGQERGQKVGK